MDEKPPRHLRPNRGQNPNARWIVDEEKRSKPTKRKAAGKPAAAPASKASKPDTSITEGETKCKCDGKVSDDKTMAECENCSTWQHVVCEAGVDDENALPDPYHCSSCREPESDQQKQSEETTEVKTEEVSAKPGTIDSIEDKVRKSVAEAWLRVLEKIAQDTGSQASELEKKAVELEAALFEHFNEDGSVGNSYREQFRTLSFNLKDEKNRKLQLNVLNGSKSPDKFVQMTSEELRNPELQHEAQEIHEESIRETIIPPEEPPTEVISYSTAEVNAEPSAYAEEQLQEENEDECEEHMKEPLGPPPSEQEAQEAQEAEESKPQVDEVKVQAEEEEPKTEVMTFGKPAWEGPVKLEDESIQFTGSGLHLAQTQSPKVPDWSAIADSELVVRGLVLPERAFEYLRASASEDQGHKVEALAFTAAEPSSQAKFHEYIESLDRVGSVKSSRSNVKDAYLIPLTDKTDLSYLQLTEESKQTLHQLKTKHEGKILLAVYVLNI